METIKLYYTTATRLKPAQIREELTVEVHGPAARE